MRLRRWLVVACLVVGLGAALVVMRLDARVQAYLAGPPLGGARMYAAPTPLAVGEAVPGGSLARKPERLGYRPGVDPVAIARALRADLRAHAVAQGASTLTQQLVKNVFLSSRRTLSRKLREAVLALLLEARASKEEILARYVASVYLGVDGGLPVHGFGETAQVYFGKPLGELEPAECALLAGIIRSPNGLSPRRRARAALTRRNRVLEQMVQDGLLDKAVGAEAMATPLKLVPPRARPVAALYVASEVARQLPQLLPRAVAEAPGPRVFTSIDAG